MQPLFFCRCRLVKNTLPFFALLLMAAAQGARPVFAQDNGAPPEARQTETWNKSLRRAALQLAAVSLSDGSGSGVIAPPLRLPQKIVLLPLFVERGSGRGAVLPIAEPTLRARLADYLSAARYGDIAIFAPLSSREASRITRLTPGGVGKNAKLDKTLDAARKSGADYVLHGTLTPAPGKTWLLTVYLVSVNRGGTENDAPTLVKATVSGTLRFTEADR